MPPVVPRRVLAGETANPASHSTVDGYGGMSVAVAPHLRPARTFDTVSALVIEHLTRVEPLGMWAVTRVVDGRQIILTVDAPAYGIISGAEIPYASSMCRSMVTGTAPQIAPDITQVPAYAAVAPLMPISVGAYLGTPIVRPDGTLFGTICGYDPNRQPHTLTAHQALLDLLSSMLSAVLAADSIAVATARELEIALLDAETDTLTGLLNRRGWDRYLLAEEERFRRFGDTAFVIILDLDNLKSVNDIKGHEAGDNYICETARVLRATVRPGDILSRLGGDEFGIIAVGATSSQAENLVLRMESALQRAGVSGSFGHAPYGVVTGFPGAWRAADKAMYAQKRLHRMSRAGFDGEHHTKRSRGNDSGNTEAPR